MSSSDGIRPSFVLLQRDTEYWVDNSTWQCTLGRFTTVGWCRLQQLYYRVGMGRIMEDTVEDVPFEGFDA